MSLVTWDPALDAEFFPSATCSISVTHQGNCLVWKDDVFVHSPFRSRQWCLHTDVSHPFLLAPFISGLCPLPPCPHRAVQMHHLQQLEISQWKKRYNFLSPASMCFLPWLSSPPPSGLPPMLGHDPFWVQIAWFLFIVIRQDPEEGIVQEQGPDTFKPTSSVVPLSLL